MGNAKSPLDTTMVSDPLDGHSDPAEMPVPSPDSDAILAEATRPWRAAESLKALLRCVDTAFPGRDKKNDGMIGDAAHQSRASDHNPWVIDGSKGVVTAIDITHHPASGCDVHKLVAALHASRDKRIKYIIWNRRIANSSAIRSVPAWTWRSYSGANPHTHHFHLSVHPDKALYDDAAAWTIEQIAEAVAPASSSDIDDDILAAMSALGLSVDPGLPALPQLAAWQEALAQLRVNQALYWDLENNDIVVAEAAPDFTTLKPKYEQLFATAKLRDDRRSTVAWYLKMLRKGRVRYDEVEAATQAPWWFVGIVHAMEAAFSFDGHLHNGDPLSARTVQVPRNRPQTWNPPGDWLSSAVDAITYQGHTDQSDWSLARALYRFEGYNGFGYNSKGINSPYLWSFTNHYTKGKYVRDHRYDPNAGSKQCGAAAMLRALVDTGEVTIST